MMEWFTARWQIGVITAGGYAAGWVAGTVLNGGLLEFVAWALAAFSASLVMAAVVDSGHRRQQDAWRSEVAAAKRRADMESDRRRRAEIELRLGLREIQ